MEKDLKRSEREREREREKDLKRSEREVKITTG